MEMYNASFGTPAIPVHDEVVNGVNLQLEGGKIPLLVLDMRYNAIKPYALDSNLLSYDTMAGEWQDVSGRSETPYTQERLFAMTPAVTQYFQDTLTFILDPSLYFTNVSQSITLMEVDFGDGAGWRPVDFNVPYQVVYEDTGGIVIHMRVTYGTKDYTAGAFSKNDGDFTRPDVNMVLEAQRIMFTGTVKARVTILYGEGNSNCIRRPLIFVEGIDYGTSAPYKKSSYSWLRDFQNGDFGWPQFVTGGVYDESVPGIKENRYPEILKITDFISRARQQGYDIILLDFADGATFIQDNAMVFVELVKWVRDQQCREEEIVVMGASMGGQVARYGLRWMELNNEPHCTRLYVSFDSPHKGANIPMGMQYMAKFHSHLQKTWNSKLMRQASIQLLHDHASVYPNVHPRRTEYLNEMQTMGYPQYCRNVAITNGSLNSIDQSFSPNEKLFKNNYFIYRPVAGGKDEIWALRGSTFILNGVQFNNVVYKNTNTPLKHYMGRVNSTIPLYDNAPGSQRADLADFTGTAYHDRYNFIASISSLDVNTTDLQKVILNVIPNDRPHLDYPFEAFHGPDNANELHVQATNGTGSDASNNIAWTIDEILNSRHVYPATLSIAYNYGYRPKRVLFTTSVNNGGHMRINTQGSTGDGNQSIEGNFKIHTTTCGATITVNTGGIVEIGDPANSAYTGTLIITSGSIFNLNGGTLKINDNSRLIIEEGAELVFNSGVID
ncbi:MAG: hypothetical protein M3Q97_09345, partial [Bacteroidota bacterium]|nr:hypothetical protein [Bacteroidota bacterium]